MKPFADNLLLCLIGASCAAAAAVVAVGPSIGEHAASAEGDFQRALGGFGIGPQVGLSHCSWQLDPRLAGDDDPGLDCIPGLSELSPWHAIALFPPPQPFTVGD